MPQIALPWNGAFGEALSLKQSPVARATDRFGQVLQLWRCNAVNLLAALRG
jgi:hypothetical protein